MNAHDRSVLADLLDIVEDLSDKEFLTKAWILGEYPNGIDYDETVCIFEDVVNYVISKHFELKITNAQYQLLKQFRDTFDQFSDNNDEPEEFIDSPEWAKIMKMAKEVLVAFNYIKA